MARRVGNSNPRARTATVLVCFAMAFAQLPVGAFHEPLHNTSEHGQDSIVLGTQSTGRLGAALAVGDVNGSGQPDLIISEPGSGLLHVIWDGPLTEQEWVALPGAVSAPDVTIHTPGGAGELLTTYRHPLGRDGIVLSDGENGVYLFPVPTESGDYVLFEDIIPTEITVEGLISSIAVGDIEGSGTDQLVIGAAAQDSVWVYDTTGELRFSIFGPEGASFGASVAVGELNNPLNEPRDIVVGAPTALGPGGEINAGAVYVFFDPIVASDGGSIAADDGEYNLLLQGGFDSGEGHRLGTAVAVGDVTGDGAANLIAGAPMAEDGTGLVYVVAEDLSEAEGYVDLIDALPGFTLGAVNARRFGSALAIADVIVDGVADVIVSSIGTTDEVVTVVVGGDDLGATQYTFIDGQPSSQFGAAIAAADAGWLAVGAPQAAGLGGSAGEVSIFAAVEMAEPPVGLVVNSTGDAPDANPGDGVCSTVEAVCTLRAAIQEANATPGHDTITFDLAFGSVISPATPLPTLTGQVTIDGGTCGTPGVLLNGSGVSDSTAKGLVLGGGGSTIRGLAIGGWTIAAITLASDGNTVECNWLGIDPGAEPLSNAYGVEILNSSGNFVGTATGPNVISGNTTLGVFVINSGSVGNVVSNNIVGLDPSAETAIPNGTGPGQGGGVGDRSGVGTVIEDNVIAGNDGAGIYLFASGFQPVVSDTIILGNTIGTGPGGIPLPNTGPGILADRSVNLSIGANDGAGNIIAHNGSDGIRLTSANGVEIVGNTIHSNGGVGVNVFTGDLVGILSNSINDNTGLGIRLGAGANGSINTVDFLAVAEGEGEFTITGQVDVVTGNHTIQFFASESCDPSGFGEGHTFIGEHFFSTTAAEPPYVFAVDVAGVVPGAVTATVTADIPLESGLAHRTSEFSECAGTASSAPVVDSLFVNVDASQTGPGATSVNLIDIPIEAVFGAAESSTSASPLGAVPLGAIDLAESPLGAIPLAAVPLGAIPLAAVPLAAIPLGAVTVDYPGGWLALLAGTPFDGRPLQTILLSEVMAYAAANPGSDLAGVTIEQVSLDATPLGAVSLMSIALGAAPLAAISPETCSAATAEGLSCGSTTTLLELELAGFDVAAAPLGAVPLGAIPLGAVPLGAIPLGAVPLGAIPLGAVPLGAIPLGAVPLGAISAEAIPLGAIPLSAVSVDGAPLGAIPLSAVPLGAIPLGAVPLGAIDLAGTPLGAVPLAAVGGCDLLVGFAHTCSSLQATGDTDLFELAVLLEAAGSSLAASPLGAITLDQLPLSAIDPLTVLGLDATLSEVFEGTALEDVADWGSITLGQIIIAMLIAADYPWETLAFDELGVQDFATTGDLITYTALIGVSGSGVIEVTANLPTGYRYRAGSATLNESSILDPVVDQTGGVQTLRFFVSMGSGSNDLAFTVAPSLRLGTSEIAVNAGDESFAGAPHTVVEPAEFSTLAPDVLYFGYITARDDVDTYEIVRPGEGFRTSVFLAHLSADVDLVMYRPTDAPVTVAGTPLGAIPFRDEGFRAGRGLLAPEALADIPISDPDSVADVSANRDTTPESTSVLEDGNGVGNYSIQVSGYNGTTSDEAYVLRAKIRSEVPTPICTPRGALGAGSNSIPASPGLESLFVVNGHRLDALHGAGSAASVLAALNDIVAYLNDPANGFGSAAILRVDGVNYGPWDTNPCDPRAANAIAQAIRAPIVSYADANPSLKYVTILGSDEVIPFFRQRDDTAYANESTYAGEFEDNALFGSFLTRHILTDDGYGDPDPIPWLDRALFLPELGVGRLVEEPADIVGQLNTFIAFDGSLDPVTGFVAGYDFLSDGAAEVAANLADAGVSTSTLISETWSASELIDRMLVPGAVPDLSSPNAHYDHHRALPAAEQGTPDGGLTSDVLFDVGDLTGFATANPGDLSRKIIFTMGCHAGTSVADISVTSTSLTNPTDWAQVYGREAATYVANTGYGYGDTVTVALSEKLMAEFAARLDGSMSAGQALVGAKQHYFGTLGLYGVYDEKVMQEIVYYGLPMYRVGAPAEQPTPPPPPTVTPDPGMGGVGVAAFEVFNDFTAIVHPERGTFYTIDGDTQGIHYRPIQPKTSLDVTVAGKVARGALITSLNTTEVTVNDPAFFRPTIDLSANEPEIENFDVIFPTTFATVATFQVPSTDPGQRTETRQNLNLIAGQYVGETRTQRLFDSVGIEVLYVDEGTAITDFTPPQFESVQAVLVGNVAGFIVDLADNQDAVRVLVLYRDGSGVWKSAELQSGSPWTGGGLFVGSEIEFFVQAVDAFGNLGLTSFKGALHEGEVLNTATDGFVDPAVTVTVVEGTLVNDWYTGAVTVSVSGDNEYSATVDGVPQQLAAGQFTIEEDGLHIVHITGGAQPVTFAVPIDRSAPTIVIRTPVDGATYLLGQSVLADYRCADSGSGVTTCTAPVVDGAPIETASTGTKNFTVSATDRVGNSATTSHSYQVVRALDLLVVPDLVPVATTVTATSPLDGAFDQAAIDWGDGTICTIGVAACTVTSGALSATHAYPATGVYIVTLTVDYGDIVLTDIFEYVVVYDPSAGFVTGGGSIDSPPGAFVDDPSLVGDATFGFVSRYQRGATVPTGNTTFQFRAAALHFKSTEYEWLVVSGSGHRGQFKGSGTVNGAGDYGFMLTVIDAANTNSTDVDLFRIKIWDRADDDQIVYDNELGSSDNSDPTTGISSGSIVIHTGGGGGGGGGRGR